MYKYNYNIFNEKNVLESKEYLFKNKNYTYNHFIILIIFMI